MAKLSIRISIAVIGLLLLLTLSMLFQSGTAVRIDSEMSFSSMLDTVDAGRVRDVKITGHKLLGILTDGRGFETTIPDDPTLARDLAAKHVGVVIGSPEDEGNPLLRTVIAWLPTLLISGIWLFWLRRIAAAITGLDRTLKTHGSRSTDLGH